MGKALKHRVRASPGETGSSWALPLVILLFMNYVVHINAPIVAIKQSNSERNIRIELIKTLITIKDKEKRNN